MKTHMYKPRSLNRRLEFFENFDPETPEKASTRQPLQEVHQWTKRAKRSSRYKKALDPDGTPQLKKYIPISSCAM